MATSNLKLFKENPSHFLEKTIKDYVVNMYAIPNDGMIDVPIYVIINDGAIQASGIVKSLQEITNLVQSWETWLKLQSSDSETE